MKILIAGSHFTPAQAVIEELISYNGKSLDDIKIVYIGRKYTREGDNSPSIESQVLPKLGIKFIPIIAGKLQRTLTLYALLSLFKIPIGFLQSFWIILNEKPDVVLSFGGYVSVPIVFSAWLFSIPILIHEQTLISGLANKVSSLFADKMAISFKKNMPLNEGKTILTGNPMRGEITNPLGSLSGDYKNLLKVSTEEKLPLLLVTGGNQGSHIINMTISEILEKLLHFACVIHQTGDSKFQDFEKLVEKKKNLKNSNRYLVKKWIDAAEFGNILKDVDLAVSRGGANTLSELAFFGIPTLVIPLPYIYQNEQMVNARYFEHLGLARVLPQSKLSKDTLMENLQLMVKDLQKFKDKASNAKGQIIVDASKRLMLETLLLAKRSESGSA